MTDAADTFDLKRTYIHLLPGTGAARIPVDDAFWAEIATRTELYDGRLVVLSRYAADWTHWERHPAGEEVLFLLDGAVDMVVEQADGGTRVIALRGRAACIMPRGLWHRGIVHEPGDVLHITPGAGTEHRPL
ncbi:MAG: hypothetical protein H6907_00560 [Hyphomicrobiales bacterium]|nr:hypothetical protein [Hyphomicrobiales bacterium]MCP5370202.1 hypothetical protein [Hyphomicrobiales bacterium]